MPKHRRSLEELETSLKEQLFFLRASARSYDEGHLIEAKRLATSVFTLVHDGGTRSVSVLTQMGLRGSLRFVDSALDLAPNMIPWMPLVVMRLSGEDDVSFQPLCALDEPPMPPRQAQFAHWWDAVIFKAPGSPSLNRKNLVFSLRNQDGGSHVDSALTDSAYHALINLNDPRLTTKGGSICLSASGNFSDEHKPIPNPHLVMMRQIAWELDRTLISAGY